MLEKIFLKFNNLFPQKEHPFNTSKDGVLDLNYSDFEYRHAPGLIQMYLPYFDESLLKNAKILDIGCGAGGKSVYFAEKYNAQVTGIDVSKDFLKQANNFIKEKGQQDNVSVFYESALDMSFKQKSFDVVIMSDVLEHIPNTELLLTEVMRVLKKGGIVLFDFAPYYHYYGHHLWDTLFIPWLHVFTTESFRISLYKMSVAGLPDGKKRINLRISQQNGIEKIDYLNKITLKKFKNIVSKLDKKGLFGDLQIHYFMLKNINILINIPILRELFIRHIVGVLKK